MTYLQEMARHEVWMANSRRASKEFTEEMRVMDAELAKVEAFVDEDDDRAIAPDTFNEDFRLLPDGFTVGEHRSGKCGGASMCQYCEAQADADVEADEVESATVEAERCNRHNALNCGKCNADDFDFVLEEM